MSRAAPGTRLEETERIFGQVDALIRRTIPKDELRMVLDNIGLPSSGTNLALIDAAMIGPQDGEILVALAPEHAPTGKYVASLRKALRDQFPQLVCFFQPADIVSQILNFGLPAPIDIQIVGRDLTNNFKLTEQIRRDVSRIPGAVDVHVHQITDLPEMLVKMDRTRGILLGMSERDVAQNMLISLSSSSQTAPNFWLNPKNGVSYCHRRANARSTKLQYDGRSAIVHAHFRTQKPRRVRRCCPTYRHY